MSGVPRNQLFQCARQVRRIGYVLCLLLGVAAAAETADEKAAAFRNNLADQIDFIARHLNDEARRGAYVANDIRRAPPGDAPAVLEHFVAKKSGLARLVRPTLDRLEEISGPMNAVKPTAKNLPAIVEPDSSTDSDQQVAATDIDYTSLYLTDYAWQLTVLANQVREAPPEDALALIDKALIPGEVAAALNPLEDRSVAEQPLIPFIAGGGEASVDYPAVAAILYDDGNGGLYTACTGTLVAPNAVLTAGHCAHNMVAGHGRVTPVKVYFHHASPQDFSGDGAYEVKGEPDVNEHFHYVPPPAFNPYADLAILFLTRSVTGIAPAPMNRSRLLPPETTATIVGFGMHRVGLDQPPTPSSKIDPRTGIKVHALVTTNVCTGTRAEKSLICWTYDPSLNQAMHGTTCRGDSGGPLVAQIDGKSVLAGVTSAGQTCKPQDTAVDVEVFPYVDWISGELEKNPPPGPDTSTHYVPALEPFAEFVDTDVPSVSLRIFPPSMPTWKRVFQLSPGVSWIRVAVNATTSGGPIQLDLTAGNHHCSQRSDTTTAQCVVKSPPGGKWLMQVFGVDYQQYQAVIDTRK